MKKDQTNQVLGSHVVSSTFLTLKPNHLSLKLKNGFPPYFDYITGWSVVSLPLSCRSEFSTISKEIMLDV